MKFTLPEQQFEWAGFAFPKWLWTLPTGVEPEMAYFSSQYAKQLLEMRLKDRKNRVTGPYYYHAPQPNTGHTGGYELPMRWRYCDVVNKYIGHTGWFVDDDGFGGKLRGVVIRLPKSRGFLVGWTMGEGMCCQVDSSEIFDDEIEAANAADNLARDDAEREREYQEAERIRERMEENDEDARQRAEFDKDLVPGASLVNAKVKAALEAAEDLGLVVTVWDSGTEHYYTLTRKEPQ